MRCSMRSISAVSPRPKNMPALVRASFDLATASGVVDRLGAGQPRRGELTQRITLLVGQEVGQHHDARLAHRHHELGPPRPSGRRTSDGDCARSGSGTGTAGGRSCRRACSARKLSSVCSSAASATSSSQPDCFIACRTASGEWPAWACSRIQSRSSGVAVWVLMVVLMQCCREGGTVESGLGIQPARRRKTQRSRDEAVASKP